MALPQIAAMTALSVVGYHLLKSPTTDLLEESHYGCNHKYCPPTYQIHVDPAVKTTLRDDRLGATTLRGVYSNLKSQYMREASEHPGVALVAHTIN